MPRGRRSSTRLSPALADRDCFAQRMKSSSPSDIERVVVSSGPEVAVNEGEKHMADGTVTERTSAMKATTAFMIV